MTVADTPDFVVRDGKPIDLRFLPKLWLALSENGPSQIDLQAAKRLWSGVDGAIGITILNFGFSSKFSIPALIGLLHQDTPITQHRIPGPFVVLKGVVTNCSAQDAAVDILHGGQVGVQLVERLLSIEQLPLPKRATTDRRTILPGTSFSALAHGEMKGTAGIHLRAQGSPDVHYILTTAHVLIPETFPADLHNPFGDSVQSIPKTKIVSPGKLDTLALLSNC